LTAVRREHGGSVVATIGESCGGQAGSVPGAIAENADGALRAVVVIR
jgi:hypothetical protein